MSWPSKTVNSQCKIEQWTGVTHRKTARQPERAAIDIGKMSRVRRIRRPAVEGEGCWTVVATVSSTELMNHYRLCVLADSAENGTAAAPEGTFLAEPIPGIEFRS